MKLSHIMSRLIFEEHLIVRNFFPGSVHGVFMESVHFLFPARQYDCLSNCRSRFSFFLFFFFLMILMLIFLENHVFLCPSSVFSRNAWISHDFLIKIIKKTKKIKKYIYKKRKKKTKKKLK